MPTSPYLPLPYRVIAVRQDTPDTATVDLMPVGAAIPEPAPGQFTMLYVLGVGEAPISVSGAPIEGAPLAQTLRGVGAVSKAVIRLQPGQELGVRGPYGTIWPVAEADGHDVLFIAGGLGLAPLRPAVRHVLANRERYGRVSLCTARAARRIFCTVTNWRCGGACSMCRSRSRSTAPTAPGTGRSAW